MTRNSRPRRPRRLCGGFATLVAAALICLAGCSDEVAGGDEEWPSGADAADTKSADSGAEDLRRDTEPDARDEVDTGKSSETGFNPLCSDGLQNGAESDVDCGGASCAKCSEARSCWDDSDCVTDNCIDGTCGPPPCPQEGCPDGTVCAEQACRDLCDDGKFCTVGEYRGPEGFCGGGKPRSCAGETGKRCTAMVCVESADACREAEVCGARRYRAEGKARTERQPNIAAHPDGGYAVEWPHAKRRMVYFGVTEADGRRPVVHHHEGFWGDMEVDMEADSRGFFESGILAPFGAKYQVDFRQIWKDGRVRKLDFVEAVTRRGQQVLDAGWFKPVALETLRENHREYDNAAAWVGRTDDQTLPEHVYPDYLNGGSYLWMTHFRQKGGAGFGGLGLVETDGPDVERDVDWNFDAATREHRFDFSKAPRPTSDVEVGVLLQGDFNGKSEYVDVYANGQKLGRGQGESKDCKLSQKPETFVLSEREAAAQWPPNIRVELSKEVGGDCGPNDRWVTVELTYNHDATARFDDMDAAGLRPENTRLALVWREEDKIRSQVFDAAGVRSAPFSKRQTLSYAASPEDVQVTAVPEGGGFVVTWPELRNGEQELAARAFKADGTPRGEKVVHERAGIQIPRDIVPLSTRRVAVVMQTRDSENDDWDVEVAILSVPKLKLLQTIRVNDQTAGDQLDPEIAALKSRDFVVVFRDGDKRIWTRRFDIAGQPVPPPYLR